jgi:hypothetical protein
LWYLIFMSVLVARHAFSEANNRETLAFGRSEARLALEGRAQAKDLGRCLAELYGVDLAETPVAASELFRAPETAIEAGFRKIVINPLLNEVASGLTDAEYKEAKEARELPQSAREAAMRVLDSPPPEGIWIAHGLLIAGLCDVLQVAQDQRFIPKFCEIRELPIELSAA